RVRHCCILPYASPREQGDGGAQAARGSSARWRSGYQRLPREANAPLRVCTRVGRSRWAPRVLHYLCGFVQHRVRTTRVPVDSTPPVAQSSPPRERSPSCGITYDVLPCMALSLLAFRTAVTESPPTGGRRSGRGRRGGGWHRA